MDQSLFFRAKGTRRNGEETRQVYVVDPRGSRLLDGEPFDERKLKQICGTELEEVKALLRNLVSKERDRLRITPSFCQTVHDNVDKYAENYYIEEPKIDQQYTLDESFVHDKLPEIQAASKFQIVLPVIEK